jgi:type I restriction enzyme S subunit
MVRTDSPSDWQVLPLSQLAQIERGKFTARPRNDPRYYGGSIPFIQTGDVRNSGGRITSYSQTLNERGLKVSKLFPVGTLFMTIAANIGDLGVAEFASACPDSLVAVRPRTGVDQLWLYYALAARKADLESIATQNAQANLNLEKLNPFLVEVPPHREQVAIATMVDDVSRLIAVIERQIAKKQAVKQGLMQQLLAGRTRLPGFDAEWPESRLGLLASGSRGAGLSKSVVRAGGAHPCILYGELFTTYGRMIAQAVSRTDAISTVRSTFGQVLLPGSTTTVATDLATASALLQPDVLLGGDINIVSPRLDRLDPVWLAMFLTSQRRQQIGEAAQGITIMHLYVRDVLALEIPVPPLEEQQAIAAVLNDAEHELAVLRARVAKTRAIRQGMMQQLLTGRTRVPAAEGAA